VYDATAANWVDRFAPPKWRPYLRLSRADRPIGTWLLLLPAWWGVLLAICATDWRLIDVWLLLGSALGAFLMRGAGCTYNDLIDREIDAKVERTRSRPLPSGQVTANQATLWMLGQALAAFLILITFNWVAILLGIVSCGLVAAYPFAKRFTWWPQVFLGLAFNWGVILMWAAHTGGIGVSPIFLYLAGIAWTLHYDTIYAHQDREDDALIGVKSTARLFEQDTGAWLMGFTAAVFVFGLFGILLSGGMFGLIGLFVLCGQMAWQIKTLDINDPDRCLQLFRASRWGGLAIAVGLFIDSLF